MSYKIFNFKSLKIKVLFWFVSIVSIVLFLFSFLLYYFLEQSINLRIETNLYHTAISVKEALLKNKQIESLNLDGSEVVVIKNNKITQQTKTFKLKNPLKYTNRTKHFFLKEIDEYRIDGTYVLKIEKKLDSYIIVYKQGFSNKAEDVEDILLVLNPMLLLFLIVIGNKLIDKILIPIKTLTKSAKNITIDNFSHTIKMPKDDNEIKELIESFNEMIIRLRDGTKVLDRFNSDISHELKTPLTVIQGELELSLRKERGCEYYKNSITTSLKQVMEIKNLIDALLLLTKYSKQNIANTFTKTHLDSIVLDVCDRYENHLKTKNIKLDIERLDSIVLDVNKFLISSIFSNILDNAIKYTTNNKGISISLYKNEHIHFIVKDEGIGIDNNEIDKLTDRFYRVDESRNKDIKGFGLGLSIVKNSVELHDGVLKISSKKGLGTTVEIIL